MSIGGLKIQSSLGMGFTPAGGGQSVVSTLIVDGRVKECERNLGGDTWESPSEIPFDLYPFSISFAGNLREV
jgi:hypothetical protein